MSKEKFIGNIARAICDFGMAESAGYIVAALSGGADSVSLLRALTMPKLGLCAEIRACHLNHGLRGAESDSDELFCRRLCDKLGIPLTVRRINVNALREKHESVEEAARRLRYDFFRETVGESGGVLATAHTASDNAETVLFNLVRGTGASGLCGIPPVRRSEGLTVIRPLIYCTRGDVEEFLAELGQGYVTDKSNLNVEFSRNRLRLNVIPELEKINPAVVSSVSRMTKTLRADNDYLEELTSKALDELKSGRGWNAAGIGKLPEPLKYRAVRRILSLGGIEPSALRINTAAELLDRRSARYNPCKDKFFTIRKGVCFTENIRQNYNGFNEKKLP